MSPGVLVNCTDPPWALATAATIDKPKPVLPPVRERAGGGRRGSGGRGICREDVPTAVAKRLLDQVDPKWGSYETP